MLHVDIEWLMNIDSDTALEMKLRRYVKNTISHGSFVIHPCSVPLTIPQRSFFYSGALLPGEIQRQQMCRSRQFQFIGDAQLFFERDSRLPDVEMTL